MSTEANLAIKLIREERQGQIEQHGWTPEHDDTHDQGQIGLAAAEYARRAGEQSLGIYRADTPHGWPFSGDSWKPSYDRKRNLVKAGALILAELERVIREEAR